MLFQCSFFRLKELNKVKKGLNASVLFLFLENAKNLVRSDDTTQKNKTKTIFKNKFAHISVSKTNLLQGLINKGVFIIYPLGGGRIFYGSTFNFFISPSLGQQQNFNNPPPRPQTKKLQNLYDHPLPIFYIIKYFRVNLNNAVLKMKEPHIDLVKNILFLYPWPHST